MCIFGLRATHSLDLYRPVNMHTAMRLVEDVKCVSAETSSRTIRT